MSTVWWILWTIGFIDICIGTMLTVKPFEIDAIKGYILLIIGLAFNGMACIVNGHWFLAIISFVAAYLWYNEYKKEKKEFEVKELVEEFGIKEAFLKELRKYRKKNIE